MEKEVTIETLAEYLGFGPLDGYNSVHFFSESQKRNRSKHTREECVTIWQNAYPDIEIELIHKMNQILGNDQVLYLIIPPTNSERKAIYLDPLINAITKSFPKLISLDRCLEKKDKSISAAQQGGRNREARSKNIAVQKDCIDQKKMVDRIPVVILDDVIATGDTLNAVVDSLRWLSDDFYAFALLKTASWKSRLEDLKNEKL